MVFSISFPQFLTEEEELLQKKFQQLRRRRRLAQSRGGNVGDKDSGSSASSTSAHHHTSSSSASSSASSSSPSKRFRTGDSISNANNSNLNKVETLEPGEATEAAKRLVARGIIEKISRQRTGTTGFKRTKGLERRLKEGDDGERESSRMNEGREDLRKKVEETREVRVNKERNVSRSGGDMKKKGLYDSFVSANNSPITILISGSTMNSLSVDLIRETCLRFGKMRDIKTTSSGVLVTFQQLSSGNKAIKTLNGSVIGGVELKVQVATVSPVKDQPLVSPPVSPTVTSRSGKSQPNHVGTGWGVIASGSSDPERESGGKRQLTIYEDVF